MNSQRDVHVHVPVATTGCVAEVKRPLVEIPQSPTTSVLSVSLAACRPHHYHKGQICSANGARAHTDTHTHTHTQNIQKCQVNIWPRSEHSSESTFRMKHVHTHAQRPGTCEFHHIYVCLPQCVITWLEYEPVRACACLWGARQVLSLLAWLKIQQRRRDAPIRQ